MATTVSDVLKQKGYSVVTVVPEQTIASVIDVLTRNRIGAAPVADQDGRLIGIISERDIIRGLAEFGKEVLEAAVDRLMTREVVSCSLEDSIVGLMEVMTNQRFRHLPVIQNGTLRGIVSIGDVVKQRLTEAQFELDELRRYITTS
ncbi:MAG: CBS domain-containing protein [Deltaproteobacteria bacterium]|nr:CBS domain-containing protein [Deltaproteobacteria bacterium]